MIWDLTRSLAFSGYIMLFLSVVLGILLSTKRLKKQPLILTTHLHHFASISGLALIGLHLYSLLFDRYLNFSLPDLLIPFYSGYETMALSLGILAFYLILLVFVTSQGKRSKLWKVAHMLSYPGFMMGLFHGLFIGTDSADPVIVSMYFITGIIPIMMLTLRPLLVKEGKKHVITPS